MAKQIARLLKTNMMADIDMPALAQFLQSQGRKGDTVLAHINPKEAALLQKMGGAGTENPATGLPEFYDRRFNFDYDPEPMDISDIAREQRFRQYQNPEEFDFSSARTPIIEPTPQRTDTYFSGRQSRPSYAGGSDTPDVNANTSFPGTTIDSSYLNTNRYNITGAGDFGVSPAMANTDFTPSVPTRPDTYFFGRQAVPAYGAFQDSGSLTAAEDFARRMDVGAERGRQPGEGNFLRRGVEGLKEITGLSGSELAQLGLAGGLGIQGALAARNLAEQGEEARAEQEAIAAPYRERGAALLAQAEGGQLTPQAQQSLQAMRARLAQGAEARGGVGAQQVAAQVEAFRQQLLANQYDYGMKVSNIGDNLMLGAIRTGLEADRYATQMTNSYYTNMARILGGMGQDTEAALQQGAQIQQQVRGVR
jgi:hypothetical protein